MVQVCALALPRSLVPRDAYAWVNREVSPEEDARLRDKLRKRVARRQRREQQSVKVVMRLPKGAPQRVLDAILRRQDAAR